MKGFMTIVGKFINVIFFLYSAALLVVGVYELVDAMMSRAGDYAANSAVIYGFSYTLIWLALYGMREATVDNSTS